MDIDLVNIDDIDQHIVILVWNPKVEDTLRPLKTIDFMKAVTKKSVNDKFIELLQIG